MIKVTLQVQIDAHFCNIYIGCYNDHRLKLTPPLKMNAIAPSIHQLHCRSRSDNTNARSSSKVDVRTDPFHLICSDQELRKESFRKRKYDEPSDTEFQHFKRSRTLPPTMEGLKPYQKRRSSQVRKALALFSNNSLLYPDTSYSYFTRPVPITSSERSTVDETERQLQNEKNSEIRDYLLKSIMKIGKVDQLKRQQESLVNSCPRIMSLSHLKKPTKGSKFASFIENRLQQNHNYMIPFPFESNYTYQSSGFLRDIESFKPTEEVKRKPQPTKKHNLPVTPVMSSAEVVPQRRASIITESPSMHTFYRSPISSPVREEPISPSRSEEADDSVVSHKLSPHSSRVCISCGCSQSPCWRPSWSANEGQLCNSCGLRYKKTGARCLNPSCLRIPAKGEWTLMRNKGKLVIPVLGEDGQVLGMKRAYKCLHCDSEVQVQDSN